MLGCDASLYTPACLVKTQMALMTLFLMQALSRYIEDSAGKAHVGSDDATDDASEGASDAALESGDSDDASAASDAADTAEAADARTGSDSAAQQKSLSSRQNSTVYSDHASEGADPRRPSQAAAHHKDAGRGIGQAQHQSHDHVPDHVIIRGQDNARQQAGTVRDDDGAGSDADDQHSVAPTQMSQRPDQAAVQQRVLNQHRTAMRKQLLSRATRNAQKSHSKKDRKQTPGQVDW